MTKQPHSLDVSDSREDTILQFAEDASIRERFHTILDFAEEPSIRERLHTGTASTLTLADCDAEWEERATSKSWNRSDDGRFSEMRVGTVEQLVDLEKKRKADTVNKFRPTLSTRSLRNSYTLMNGKDLTIKIAVDPSCEQSKDHSVNEEVSLVNEDDTTASKSQRKEDIKDGPIVAEAHHHVGGVDHVSFNCVYLCQLTGAMKMVNIGLLLLILSMITTSNQQRASGFVYGVSVASLIVTSVLLICYLLNQMRIQRTLLECISNGVLALCCFIAGCLVAVFTTDKYVPSILTAFFFLLASVVYIVDTVLSAIKYSNG